MLAVSSYEVVCRTSRIFFCGLSLLAAGAVLHVFEARAERVLLDSGFVQGADGATYVSDLLPDHAGWARRQGAQSETLLLPQALDHLWTGYTCRQAMQAVRASSSPQGAHGNAALVRVFVWGRKQ